MYEWILLIHILSAFIFAFIHGASTKVIFRLGTETEPARLSALLDLSGSQLVWLYASLLVMLASGMGVTYLGNWWRSIWVWLSLALLVLMVPAMYGMATIPLNRVRKALGLPYSEKNKPQPAVEPSSPEEITSSLASLKPWLNALIGYGGLALILALMVLKPF